MKLGFCIKARTLSEICSRYHDIAYNTYVICSQSVIDENVGKKIGVEKIKPGGAWSTIIEAGTGNILSGPLAPDEEGILYADIDLNMIPNHYFLHETTGNYWPKQFQVYFDNREIKPMNITGEINLKNKDDETKNGLIPTEHHNIDNAE